MNAMQMPAPYDVEAVRNDFPILASMPYGKKLVYLDNAASAQKPKQVIERLTHAYEHEYANVHRGLHYLANAATEAFEVAREKTRAFLNAGSVDEIIFTRSATESINCIAAAFGQDHIGEGDKTADVAVVPHDYHGATGSGECFQPLMDFGGFLAAFLQVAVRTNPVFRPSDSSRSALAGQNAEVFGR